MGLQVVNAAPASGAPGPSNSNGTIVAWDFDIISLNGGASANLTSGTPMLVKVGIPRSCTISNILTIQTLNGGTLTANQNFVGLYDSTGAKLATSADQAAAWAAGAGASFATTALTVAQSVAGGPSAFVFVVFLFNGTTSPQWSAGNTYGALPSAGNTAATGFRFCTSGTGGQTSLPASIALGSTVAISTQSIWVGLT